MRLTVTPKVEHGLYEVRDEHGNEVPIRSLTMSRDGVDVVLAARVVIENFVADVTSWSGLEHIPTDALRWELMRRGDL